MNYLALYSVKFGLSIPLLLLALSILQLVHINVLDLAFIRSAVDRGEWWRLVSGQWVHSNAYHFFSNCLVLACLIYLDRRAVTRKMVEFISLSGFCGAAVYLFCPALDYYLGLSGVLHGYLLLVLLSMRQEKPLFVYVGIVVVLTKIALEQFDLYPSAATEELIGLRVAIEAHLAGAIAAGIIFLLEYFYFSYKRR